MTNKCPCCGSDLAMTDRPIVSLDTNRLLAGGEIIQLTPREAEIAQMLSSRMPAPLDNESLISGIYGGMPTDDAYNTIKQFVFRLRRKLAPAGLSIRTIWGQGHVMEYRA